MIKSWWSSPPVIMALPRLNSKRHLDGFGERRVVTQSASKYVLLKGWRKPSCIHVRDDSARGSHDSTGGILGLLSGSLACGQKGSCHGGRWWDTTPLWAASVEAWTGDVSLFGSGAGVEALTGEVCLFGSRPCSLTTQRVIKFYLLHSLRAF